MFGMLPFERSDDNLFDTFDNFTRNFFRGSNASLPAFRTDIRDAGDKFVLEAELPGFDKGDIKLDVKDGILTITAEHSENQEPHLRQRGHQLLLLHQEGHFRRHLRPAPPRRHHPAQRQGPGVVQPVLRRAGDH